MRLLDRYIVREHIAPFFISLSLIMLLFTLNLLIKSLGRIVGQGLAPMVVVEYFFLNLAWITTLAVPMSMLVATLMGFGRLAGDLEVIAMKASGISLVRMIVPVIIMATFVGGFSLYFQNSILPEMNHRNKLLTLSIRKKKPTVALQQGIFTKDLNKQTLLIKDISAETDILYDVTIFDESSAKQPATIVADSGKLEFVDSLGMYHFRLWSGEIHQVKRDDLEGYEVVEFGEALFRIEAPETMLHRREAGYRGDRELSLQGLLERVDRLKEREQNDRNIKLIKRYLVEYHKKFTISFASIVFVLIGAPLGVKLHKGGIGVSGGLSVVFFLIYWTFLIGGEDLADRGRVSPAVAMWAPNILFSILGIFLINREMRAHTVLKLPRWFKRGSTDEEEEKMDNVQREAIERALASRRAKEQLLEDKNSEIEDNQ